LRLPSVSVAWEKKMKEKVAAGSQVDDEETPAAVGIPSIT